MLNVFTKTKPWMVASLLVATSAFGQNSKCAPQVCQKPCEKVCPEPMPAPTIAAYNAPAGIDTRCSWDVFVDATFTYWQPIMENLELGIPQDSLSEFSTIFNMDFDYKPGFKVAAGMMFDYDNWDLWAEYTWFRGTNSQTASVGIPAELATIQLAPAVITNDFLDSLTRKWTLNMDLVDLLMGREYYVGTKLTFKSFFGARGAFIRQTLNDTYVGTVAIGGTAISGSGVQTNHSWAVGPRAGLNTNWLLGEGFRLIGNGAADILYTRYTKLKNNTSLTITGSTTTLKFQQKNTGYLRTHLEMEMGLGWGSYFDNNNWHFDLAATYGFQVFFNQNMFRQFVDDFAIRTSFVPNGDMFVHGLNVTARFDF